MRFVWKRNNQLDGFTLCLSKTRRTSLREGAIQSYRTMSLHLTAYLNVNLTTRALLYLQTSFFVNWIVWWLRCNRNCVIWTPDYLLLYLPYSLLFYMLQLLMCSCGGTGISLLECLVVPLQSGSSLNCLATIFWPSFAMVSYSLWVFCFSGLTPPRTSTSKIFILMPYIDISAQAYKIKILFMASYMDVELLNDVWPWPLFQIAPTGPRGDHSWRSGCQHCTIYSLWDQQGLRQSSPDCSWPGHKEVPYGKSTMSLPVLINGCYRKYACLICPPCNF